ncbi:hypothetical protein, partial [Pseudactinotalea sp.]|uniref:hypothetical protein n=1 Tax=Pseudactinotalea sp. TaxID=1926260 RepID=UPI003B3B8EB5
RRLSPYVARRSRVVAPGRMTAAAAAATVEAWSQKPAQGHTSSLVHVCRARGWDDVRAASS